MDTALVLQLAVYLFGRSRINDFFETAYEDSLLWT